MKHNEFPLVNSYQVFLAKNEEADEIICLLKDVANWLKEEGIDQWGFLASGGEDDEIKQAINNQETFTIKKDSKLIATFTLYRQQSDWDQHTWGKLNDQAIYLHRLALQRAEIGFGLGKEVIHWLETYLRNEEIKTLRLDCVENNIQLNLFYLDNGFKKVGVSDGHSLFQKNISSI